MRKHRYIRTACAVAVMMGGIGAAHARTIALSPQVKHSGKLTIASGLDYAPMQYVDAKGHPTGMNIEMAQAVVKLLGTKLNILTIPFKAQIPALVSGRVDIGWAGYTILPERLKQVDFVSFMKAGTVVVVLPANKHKFAKKNSLCGQTVAVASGNAADGVADQLSKDCTAAGLPALKKEILPNQQATIQAVLTGRAAARLDDATSAGYYEATTKGKNVVVGVPMDTAPLGVAVRKGDTATEHMLAAAFNALIADGTYQKILKKYGMNKASVRKSIVYTKVSQLKK